MKKYEDEEPCGYTEKDFRDDLMRDEYWAAVAQKREQEEDEEE